MKINSSNGLNGAKVFDNGWEWYNINQFHLIVIFPAHFRTPFTYSTSKVNGSYLKESINSNYLNMEKRVSKVEVA